MPLVGSEVEQLRAALRTASTELASAVRAMRDLSLDGIGTPSCDVTVMDALGDLDAAVSGAGRTADDCLLAMNRHPEFAATPGSTDSGLGTQVTGPSAGPS